MAALYPLASTQRVFVRNVSEEEFPRLESLMTSWSADCLELYGVSQGTSKSSTSEH